MFAVIPKSWQAGFWCKFYEFLPWLAQLRITFRGRRYAVLSENPVPEIGSLGSMKGMWKRGQGSCYWVHSQTKEAETDRQAKPNATAPHIHSTFLRLLFNDGIPK
ncbi:hypothetical protein A1359_20225 [Methylomonas lenta]|uniref:Uncharacterized protein n=1 Tax=Methylomonas lenta TaxID=980561 RepID=A0A177NUW0_9GAMM|nr:hypothetical protein A1359_20225 [Methylomonas lenta]